MNCLLKTCFEGKTDESIEMTGRRGRIESAVDKKRNH
jgi:hypothetical protein